MTDKGEGKMHDGNLIEGLMATVDRHIAETLTHECGVLVGDYMGRKVFPCRTRSYHYCAACGVEVCAEHRSGCDKCKQTMCVDCENPADHECGGAL